MSSRKHSFNMKRVKVTLMLLLPFLLAFASSQYTESLDRFQCTDTEEALSEPLSDESKEVLNDGERAFSVDLIKSLFKDNERLEKNIFISPASIYQTLMLAYMGSGNNSDTQHELAETMGFSEKLDKAEFMKNYLYERAYQAIRDRDPNLGYQLTHANKLYFDRSLSLNNCLSTILQDELESMDLKNPEKARRVINSWVEGKTKNKIQNLLPQGSLDVDSKVVLVNSAYFKGQWLSQFNKQSTKKDNFYVRQDRISITDYMEQKGKFNYYTSEELRAHVLELPYVGDQVSMIVILPPFEDFSLHETVKRLNSVTLRGVMSEVTSGFYSIDDLTVRIPKFKVEQQFDLVTSLQQLGLDTLFDPIKSDLSGFLSSNTTNDEGKVHLQSAIHKSFIEVNEEGSEAAGATALFGFRSARPFYFTEFYANHPFLFFIYDKQSDTVLFFGVYQDPRS